jgi:hypothetical protein
VFLARADHGIMTQSYTPGLIEMNKIADNFTFANAMIALAVSVLAVAVLSFIYSCLAIYPQDQFANAVAVLWVLGVVTVARKVAEFVPSRLWPLIAAFFFCDIAVAAPMANVAWLVVRPAVYDYNMGILHNPVADKTVSGLTQIEMNAWPRVQKHPGFLWYTPYGNIKPEVADPVFDEHVFLLFGMTVVCIGVSIWRAYTYRPPVS